MITNQTVILLDIEGTITPMNFVKDVLFPYITSVLEDYINTNWHEKEFKEDLELLKQQAQFDLSLPGFVPIENDKGNIQKESIKNNILWQMKNDRKTTALKQLQGHIWKYGYESNNLVGDIFSDVPPVLSELIDKGKKIYTYSSGSTEAQKYLFQYSCWGNISSLFTKYFDTKIGSKQEETSYQNIAKEIGVKCDDILFLTDVVEEAEAANRAGCNVVILIRPGNSLQDPEKISKFMTMKTLDPLVED
ncbi:enolase-phosphatase E1 [Daktulosphaira vitifoliae]|uniref:enolase-phosphatase E1 n=1 Tax=Daktulosphaira vitifoliae TaxID=58002 RepID=UPI0021AAB8B0|nr:enolase-phosphatase E1 [Daktulosphaira vitifoliae]XP_050526047.1 enolase-phosphatase E1 [Daktulosphaira vitifoliae]XP_050526048.1 enolase-phosphatase E1 [Daktulosphaira vitifoliae]XP_050526049.1 enolase-phosphatase E1 [Daktulosphaira vitifoliae]